LGRNTQRLDKGCWVRPGETRGDLRVTMPGTRENRDHEKLFQTVLRIGEEQHFYVANGGFRS